jgi:hypothetical protein
LLVEFHIHPVAHVQVVELAVANPFCMLEHSVQILLMAIDALLQTQVKVTELQIELGVQRHLLYPSIIPKVLESHAAQADPL